MLIFLVKMFLLWMLLAVIIPRAIALFVSLSVCLFSLYLFTLTPADGRKPTFKENWDDAFISPLAVYKSVFP